MPVTDSIITIQCRVIPQQIFQSGANKSLSTFLRYLPPTPFYSVIFHFPATILTFEVPNYVYGMLPHARIVACPYKEQHTYAFLPICTFPFPKRARCPLLPVSAASHGVSSSQLTQVYVTIAGSRSLPSQPNFITRKTVPTERKRACLYSYVAE